MAPSVVARTDAGATDTTNEPHNRTAPIVISIVSLVLIFSCGIILLLCARKRRRERKAFDMERQEWREFYLTYLGTVKSLERQLSCCTCEPALPWDTRGGTRPKRDNAVDSRVPVTRAPVPASNTDHLSPVLENWHPEQQEEGLQMTFWEETPSERPSARMPPLREGEDGNANPFVVGEDSDDEANAKGDKRFKLMKPDLNILDC
ncbi:hypothetical protein BN1723_001123 [Verticillium longisporum]|uniref:Uncharacterized protein n=1 Tax=Verticillium longisporum TaxID=100787 RepID=A0A0G4M4L5_VERLO|nr:hypothetical protein BN1708_004909 [Verticillium longisporum]CRK45779.1 hypothetical protein BN1723_001123 [Verticillium longisporum]